MVVHERLEFADDIFLDALRILLQLIIVFRGAETATTRDFALQNYNKKMTYARTHVIFLRVLVYFPIARLVDILHEADGDTHVACDKGGTIGAITGGELYVVGSALSGRVRRRRPITSHTGLDAILAA